MSIKPLHNLCIIFEGPYRYHVEQLSFFTFIRLSKVSQKSSNIKQKGHFFHTLLALIHTNIY